MHRSTDEREKIRKIARERNRVSSIPKVITDEEYRLMKSIGRDMSKYQKLSEFVSKHRNILRTQIRINDFVTQDDNQK